MVVRLQEGAVANFTVLRAGRANFVATVMYHVEYGEASPGDLTMLTNETLLVYEVGEWMKNISVAVTDDNLPETDEPFYIALHNATGEYGLSLKHLISAGVTLISDIFHDTGHNMVRVLVLCSAFSPFPFLYGSQQNQATTRHLVSVQRGVAELFSIVWGNTESTPNPSIVCQGWE